jgi:exodeoxyribonuclease VII large subunit
MSAEVAPAPVVSVKRLSEYLRTKFERDKNLRNVAVRGEVSNFKTTGRGNLNFDLKEGTAILHCFAWLEESTRFPTLASGLAVVATGAIKTYEQKGQYQLVVRAVELEGIGNVHALFEERKRRLAAEGIFDRRKRHIPPYPFRVALVSSRRADGAIDFETRLRRLRPHVAVVWCETSVQGANAPAQIVGALARASLLDVDVIVVTRGGGSFEDLFAFSDEGVVRAIASARHPVISAVGHTVNQQLGDFAADEHAETPSAAAERIGPETRELMRRIDDAFGRTRRAGATRVERFGQALARVLTRSKLTDAALFLSPARQMIDDAEERLGEAFTAALARRRERVAELQRKLAARDPSVLLVQGGAALTRASLRLDVGIRGLVDGHCRHLADARGALLPAARNAVRERAERLAVVSAHLAGKDPEAILQRGYAIVSFSGKIVRDAREVPAGERIAARLARGTLHARVEAEGTDGNDGIG